MGPRGLKRRVREGKPGHLFWEGLKCQQAWPPWDAVGATGFEVETGTGLGLTGWRRSWTLPRGGSLGVFQGGCLLPGPGEPC